MSRSRITTPHPSPTPSSLSHSHSNLTSPTSNSLEFRKSCAIHEKLLNADIDLIINKIYPIERGYTININENNNDNNRLIIKVDNIQQSKGTFSLSLSTTIIELFNMYKITSQEVSIRVVNPEIIHLNFVELSFKDDYISRADMWRYKSQLVNLYVYRNKLVSLFGSKFFVDEMLINDKPVKCGIITNETKIVFRSRSARLFLLIQLSEEMWNFDYSGELYFEKSVNNFLKNLFEKWQDTQSNHTVSIIFFSRTFFDSQNCKFEPCEEIASLLTFNVDSKGRYYQDYYKVVIDSLSTEDLDKTVSQLRKEFMQFPASVSWGAKNDRTGLLGRPSNSSSGNILEALNLAINVCDKHFLDRELFRTGLSINVLSAGSGVFEVSRDLTQLTKQRVIDNGIGVDFIFVGPKPLSPGLLFVFKNGEEKNSYLNPHWIEVSYFGGCEAIKGKYSNFTPLPPHKMIDITLDELTQRMGVNRDFGDAYENEFESTIAKGSENHDLNYFISGDREVEKELERSDSTALSDFSARRQKRQPGWLAALNSASLLHTLSPKSSPRVKVQEFSQDEATSFFSKTHRSRYKPFNTKTPSIKSLSEMENYDANIFLNPNVKSVLPTFFEETRIPSSSPRAGPFSLLPTLVEANETNTGSVTNTPVHSKIEKIKSPFARSSSSPFLKAGLSKVEILPFLDLGSTPSIIISRALPSTQTTTSNTIIGLHHIAPKSNTTKNKADELAARKKFEHTLLEKIHNRNQITRYFISPLDGLPDAPSLIIETIKIDDVLWLQETYRRAPKIGEISVDILASSFSSFNPFKKTVEAHKHSYKRSRWIHVFSEPREPFEINWKSLTKPAILPLTTDYFPTANELNSASLYAQYPNSLSLTPNENDFNNNLELLLQEMLGQRLGQDFQLATRGDKNEVVGVEENKKVYNLSIDGQFHQLTLDSENGNIIVMRWISKEKLGAPNLSYPYTYNLWNSFTNSFRPLEIIIASNNDDYKWNYLDQLISGYHDDLPDSLKYRRLRFCVLPNSETASGVFANAMGIPVSSKLKNASKSDSTDGSSQPNKKTSKVDLFKRFIEQITSSSVDKLGINLLESDITYPLIESVVSDKYSEERFFSLGFGNSSVSYEKTRIPLKSQNPNRYEWLQLQYDSNYHPDAAYHIELHWLAASSKSIDDWLQTSRRRAKTSALKLVQIPVQQPTRSFDPFHVGTWIEINKMEILELMLLEIIALGFIIDGVSTTGQRQYIHRTGLAIIRVKKTGFQLYSNHLRFSHDKREECVEIFKLIEKKLKELQSSRLPPVIANNGESLNLSIKDVKLEDNILLDA